MKAHSIKWVPPAVGQWHRCSKHLLLPSIMTLSIHLNCHAMDKSLGTSRFKKQVNRPLLDGGMLHKTKEAFWVKSISMQPWMAMMGYLGGRKSVRRMKVFTVSLQHNGLWALEPHWSTVKKAIRAGCGWCRVSDVLQFPKLRQHRLFYLVQSHNL